MTIEIKHATQTTKPNDASKDVGANAWNESHTLTGHDQAAHDWESSGSFTIQAGLTTIFVSHNLGAIPKVFFSSDSFVFGKITNKTETQFTFSTEAPLDFDLHVDWRAVL